MNLYDSPDGRSIKRKEEPLIQRLPLTLSEVPQSPRSLQFKFRFLFFIFALQVFFGGIKKIKIQRYVFANGQKTDTVLREKILTIPIKPGLSTGTKITFPEEGDQGPGKIPGKRFRKKKKKKTVSTTTCVYSLKLYENIFSMIEIEASGGA